MKMILRNQLVTRISMSGPLLLRISSSGTTNFEWGYDSRLAFSRQFTGRGLRCLINYRY